MTRPHRDDSTTRTAVIAACRAMNASGINQGTSGNISVRAGDAMLITPSGVPYDAMTPDMLVTLPLDGGGAPGGSRKPSSEWRFHKALLQARPEMHAVVHAHPVHCTALAMNRQEIPACHYMIAAFGGPTVRLARYALYGSGELAENVVAAMDGRHACLLENHGALVVGETLERAMWRMEELETLACGYVLARSIGTPHILSDAQIAEVAACFADYGPGTHKGA